MKTRTSTFLLLSAGVLAGWITMGAVWLATGNRGQEESDAPVISVTMADQGQKSRGGLGSLPPGTRIDDPRISFRQLDRLAENAAFDDPVAAARSAEKIPGHDNREKYFGTVLRTWGETDGKSAAEWVIQEYKGQKLTDALYYVADGWAESDPEAAGDWFLENTDGAVLEDGAWEVLEAWGRKDPEAAFEWSKELDDYTKSNILFGLAEGWAAVDPVAAAAAGMEMEGELRYDFLSSVATQWAGLDPTALGTWAQSLLSEELRAEVFMEMGEIWAQSDPEAAAAWSAALGNDADRYFIENGIAIGWSEHDPGAALDWAVNSVKDKEALSEMVGDIVFNWTNLDPAGTTEWLEQRPASAEKDTILEMFSESIVGLNPMAAVAWANEISDESMRTQQLRSLAEDWYAEEGQAALEEMRELGIPENLIEEISGL